MKRLILLLAFTGSCFAQHVYYISKSAGSNTNTSTQAQSKSTPWASLPGMPSCVSACASYTPVPGDSFIFKGGDTWVNSDLDIWWIWTGTMGSPIYVGVDQTWFTGASWTRPIWTCGGTTCTYTLNGDGFWTDYSAIQYITVDNIEVTGLFWTGTSVFPNYFSVFGSNNTFENIYAHGWTHGGGSTTEGSAVFSPSTCCGGGLNNVIQNNVIDGTDTDQESMTAFFGGGNHDVHNNIVKYVSNGLEGAADIVHDNYFGPINVSFAPGAHQNAIQQQAPVTGSTSVFIYNNVITQLANGGIVKIWTMQSAVNNGALNTYVFNNIEVNNVPGNDVDICQLGTNCGTHYFFNNTFQCGNNSSTDTCSAPGGGGPTTIVFWTNNHCITSSVCFNNLGTNVTATLTTNLTQSVATATGQGYNSGSTFAFSPTSGSGSTVTAGTNEQSLCTTIAGVNSAAGSACQNTTSYACTYNTGNHTVSCPADTLLLRPSSTPFDIGAYQYQSLAVPTSLTVTGGLLMQNGAALH